MDAFNNSTLIDGGLICEPPDPTYHDHDLAKAALGILYGLVFMTAVCGNTLVIYVVATNRNMQSVTNIFISNLALSDIVVNFTSLWLTPVYSYLGRWVWGSVMCHLVPLFQGMSTFISALTLMAIAIDRYLAILYPFRARTSLTVCITTVVSIWLASLLLVMPLAVQMNLVYFDDCKIYICREEWIGFPEMRVVYGFVVLSLQFGVPFVVIAVCYIRIWIHLMYRESMVVTTARSAADERRRRRLLKMLVAMVVIYLLCWLPVNSLNLLRDATSIDHQEYFVILFLFAHLSSMSATCWNPIVYAWMNDNFRREFKAVLPCFKNYDRFNGGRSYSFTVGRRSMATGLAASPTCETNRPSIGFNTPGDANRRTSKMNPDNELYSDQSSSDGGRTLKTIARRARSTQANKCTRSGNGERVKRVMANEISFAESPNRSPTGTVMALLTTPTRLDKSTRLANRKPTGKPIRHRSRDSGNAMSANRLSPHSFDSAGSANGPFNTMHNQHLTISDSDSIRKSDGKNGSLIRDDSGPEKTPSTEQIELISVHTSL